MGTQVPIDHGVSAEELVLGTRGWMSVRAIRDSHIERCTRSPEANQGRGGHSRGDRHVGPEQR